MKQQKILDEYGLAVVDMDIESTANSYIISVKSLQELRRAIVQHDFDYKRLANALKESERIIKGAGFSL